MDERILVVEDEEALLMTLSDRLVSEGYKVDCARDGEEGLNRASSGDYDLITLDLMLPKKSGFDVCRDLRQRGITTPVLMLTARGQTVDKVVGLKLGADDYLTKPFESIELLARIEALLRRSHAGQPANNAIHGFGQIRVDLRGTQVTRNGKLVNLSAREFQLLKYFVEHQNATVSREDILRDVWGYSTETFTRTVDVHVASLRQKIEKSPKSPEMILTVAGLGYKFVPLPPA
jgi:two-component system, OmpR family, alkaline phosphatase synthesis response regulator PhoP